MQGMERMEEIIVPAAGFRSVEESIDYVAIPSEAPGQPRQDHYQKEWAAPES